ncbi:transcriptional regulator, partial [Escherichia coli]
MLLLAGKRPYNPSNSFFISGSIMSATDRYSHQLLYAT